MRGRKPSLKTLIDSGAGGVFAPKDSVGRCPSWLTGEAKNIWRELANSLASVVTSADREKLACLCVALADVRRNTAIIEREGEDVVLSNGMRCSHPAVARKNRALALVSKMASDFGLDPTARQRIAVPHRTAADNPKARFFEPKLRIAK